MSYRVKPHLLTFFAHRAKKTKIHQDVWIFSALSLLPALRRNQGPPHMKCADRHMVLKKKKRDFVAIVRSSVSVVPYGRASVQ